MAVEILEDGNEENRSEELDGTLLGERSKHDTANSNLGALLADIAEQGKYTDTALEAMASRGDVVTNTWHSLLSRLGKDVGYQNPEFVDSIATMWMEDEEKRSVLLRSFCPDISIIPAYDGEIDKMKASLNSIVQTLKDEVDQKGFNLDESIKFNFSSRYSESLSDDLDTFCKYISDVTYNSQQQELIGSRERIKSLLPKIGRHALDTTKIATGVAAGIIIGSHLKRK